MKGLIAVIATVLQDRVSRANLHALLRLLALLGGLVLAFSVTFHLLMQSEGQSHSWLTGLYWTLTVMTTLGFGDITFHSDTGRLFSIVVLGTGVIFMLVLLPFTFIEFFYAPWMRAQEASRAPRSLPETVARHVVFTVYDAVAEALIPMLRRYGHPYVVVCRTVAEALALGEKDVSVMVGDLNDPETCRRARLDQAAMLFTAQSDAVNASVTFTAREAAPHLAIVATASSSEARDVCVIAGATEVLRLEELMASMLARRVSLRDSDAHIIGSLGSLHIAEATPAGTALSGKKLLHSRIRELTGVNVIGAWRQGTLGLAEPGMELKDHTLLVLAGTEKQIEAYNEAFTTTATDPARVLIVGGGRVGRATWHALKELGIAATLIEKDARRVASLPGAIIGDAMSMDVLRQASAREATTLIITTHDDDTNVALTIFFRKLRANWQILTRATLDRNVPTLLRAGADLVLSYASMGANSLLNILRGSDHLLLAEGVNVFPSPIPPSMAGRLLSELQVRSQTGCTIIAVESGGERVVNPPADFRLPQSGRLFLVGTMAAEQNYLERFKPSLEPLLKKRRKA